MYGWPFSPMPIGFTNEEVPTLIAQCLYDERTGMSNADQYRLNFQSSYLVTGICGGHCVDVNHGLEANDWRFNFAVRGVAPTNTLVTGDVELPIDWRRGSMIQYAQFKQMLT